MTGLKLRKMIIAALMLAFAFVLPFLVGNIPEIGSKLCPMHVPVLLCGFICGWPWGIVVGFAAPILRSLIVGMPAMYPSAIGMAFELATYGAVSGIMYAVLSKVKINKLISIYVSLITAMIAGRVVWGLARYVLTFVGESKFGMNAFIAGALTNAIPGIIVQLILIPAVLFALERAKLIPLRDK